MQPVKRRLRMQVRATPENGPGTGQAVVSTYELEYDIGWGWTEQIMSGCFTDSIAAHPTIPIFYNHNWDHAPIGSGQPTETEDNKLVVDFRLYLNLGDMVDRVYQAMVDSALEEWSIGFWAESIEWDKDNDRCDQITQGDLAEASVCIRGANPETGTLELSGRSGWLMGDEKDREAEVSRLRKRFRVHDLGGKDAGLEPPKSRSSDDEPTPADLAQALDALIDQIVVLLADGDTKGAQDLLVSADSTCDDLLEALNVPDDDDVVESERKRTEALAALLVDIGISGLGASEALAVMRAASERADASAVCSRDGCGHMASVHGNTDDADNVGVCATPDCDCPEFVPPDGEPVDEDPAADESSRALTARLMSSPWGRELLAAQRKPAS